MSIEEFEALPKRFEVREVRFWVEQPGFRTQEIVVVTRLLNPKEVW
jgi:hypothetical protein